MCGLWAPLSSTVAESPGKGLGGGLGQVGPPLYCPLSLDLDGEGLVEIQLRDRTSCVRTIPP